MNNTRIIAVAALAVIALALGIWYMGTPTAEAPAPVSGEQNTSLENASTTATTPLSETPTTEESETPRPTTGASTGASTGTAAPKPVTTAPKPVSTAPKMALVTYNGKGFSPNEITITKGDKVRFLNVSEDDMWIVSDLHPTHNTYPIKTDDGCSPTTFDMCKKVGNGGYWDFTFEREGTFGYHNEMKPVMNGKVEVNLRGEKPATDGDY